MSIRSVERKDSSRWRLGLLGSIGVLTRLPFLRAVGAVCFALIISGQRLPRPCTAAFELVTVPAVYIASTAAID